MHTTRRFLLHYLEMVFAMMIGMAVLGMPANAIYDTSDRPALLLAEMGLTMTIPMVAWMRFRGHAWRACGEMAAAMLVPTLAALALLGSGLVEESAALGIEHMAMLPSMLIAMLVRRDEYTGHRHEPEPAVA